LSSVFELTEPFGFDRKQRFWDYFDGSSLKSFWTQTDDIGSGAFAMSDSINGGFQITSGSTSGDRSSIHTDINHYSHLGSIIIGIVKSDSTTSRANYLSLASTSVLGQPRIVFVDDTADSFIRLNASDGSSSSTNTTISSDSTNTFLVKIETNFVTAKLWMDGNLEAIHTANLPDGDLQPAYAHGAKSNNARTGHIRYMECWNT